MTPEVERKNGNGRWPFAVLIMVFFCVLAMCRRPSSQKEPRIMNVFSDFVFVGSGPALFLEDESLDPRIVPHGAVAQTAPHAVTPGVQYVFHRRLHLDIKRFAVELLADPLPWPELRRPIDIEWFAREELPARLRAEGFKIVGFPVTGYHVIGEPFFSITFSNGNHEGLIWSTEDRALVKDQDVWETQDYVLVYLR